MLDYSGTERRRFVRVPFIFPVKYALAGEEDKSYHALSDNLSEGGIKIICMEKIEMGTEVFVTFALPTSEGVFEMTCRGCVVWYQELSNQELSSRNFCGVQFQEVKPEDQRVLHQFIQKILDFRGADQ